MSVLPTRTQLGALASRWLGATMPDPTGSPWPCVAAAMDSLDADELFADIDALGRLRATPQLARLWFGLGAHFHPALAGFPERGGDDGVSAFLDELQGRFWTATWWGRTALTLAATVPSLGWCPEPLDVSGAHALAGSLGGSFVAGVDQLPASEVDAFWAMVETLIAGDEPASTLICTGLLEAIDNRLTEGYRDDIRAAMGPLARGYLSALDEWPPAD